MPKTLLAMLWLLTAVPVAVALPPEGSSGRLVVDEAPQLRAEVRRLEREDARAAADPQKGEARGSAIVARARLAEAEGRMAAAAAEWRKLLAFEEEHMQRLERMMKEGRLCTFIAPAILRGPVAEARCRVALVEREPAVLADELPKVIAYYYAQLDMNEKLRQHGAWGSPEDLEDEKQMWKDLRQARLRLDAARRKLGLAGPAAKASP